MWMLDIQVLIFFGQFDFFIYVYVVKGRNFFLLYLYLFSECGINFKNKLKWVY